MFKFKMKLNDGTEKILKSNDKQKILDYIKDNLLNIKEFTQIKKEDNNIDSLVDDGTNYLSEKEQISMVQDTPKSIKWIKNTSEAVQLALSIKMATQ